MSNKYGKTGTEIHCPKCDHYFCYKCLCNFDDPSNYYNGYAMHCIKVTWKGKLFVWWYEFKESIRKMFQWSS